MAAPGWYPDPTGLRGPRGQRYWDGQRWHDTIPPPPTRASAPRWLIAAGATTALLFVGAVTAVVAKQATAPPEPPADTDRSSVSGPSTVAGRPIPPSPGEAYQIGGFGNPWLPGIYEAPGAGPGEICTWTIQRDLVGNASSVIEHGIGGPGEPQRVGLRDGQYFTSAGCGTWHRMGRI